MIYLKHFKTVIDYNNYKNSYEFILPNVSSCEEDSDFIVYNPEDEESNSGSGSGSGSSSGSGSGSGSSEPVLEENQLLCKYNVTDTTSTTKILNNSSSFASMSIDGVEQSGVVSSYTFSTTGEHIVLFTLAEGVTSIGYQAFKNCSRLTNITIGNSVTSIGSYVFSNCSGLISVTIGSSVTSIGDYAFAGCSGLTTITIPDSVTLIGEGAFINCSGLTSISVAANNQTYDSRNNCNAIIETSTNTLIVGCKNTIIPNSVTSIGNSAFYGCSGLTSITIPDSVTSIGNSAFERSGLTSITIPDSVTSINNHAFRSCSGLTSITIPNSVTSIGAYAFLDCSELTNVTIGNSVTSIGEQAFLNCSRLTSVTIGSSVTSIGSYAFESCSGLTSITCNALTAPSIRNNTFQYIKFGGTLTVPAGSTGYNVWMGTGNYYLGYYNWTKVEVLGENKVLCKYNITDTTSTTKLLYNSSSFASILIDGVEQSGVVSSYTFNATGEHTVLFTLAEGVTSIGSSAFRDCSELTSVTIPNSVTSIGNYAFYECTRLTSISIPNSVISIGESAFIRCSKLTSVTIPDSVTSIGKSAFFDCSGLTSITIPDSVTSIGNAAFSGCSGFTSISVATNNQTFDSRNNCNAIIETSTNKLIQGCKNTIIPNSVTSIGTNAFSNCYELTSITIPDSVTLIGDNAFQYCSKLTSVTIGNSVTSMCNYTFLSCSSLTSIICNIMTAPTIQNNTFQSVKTGGTLTVPVGSTGYDVWMGTGNYYLGKYNWTKVEVLGENQVLCKYNVTDTTSTTKLLDNSSSFASMSIDGVEQSEVVSSYTFDITGEHTVLFTLAKGVTSIGSSAFWGCSGLTNVIIGNSVTSIGDYAFISCSGLTTITIPDSVTSIGIAAFGSCHRLISINIPDSVISIGSQAFNNCRALTNITIPDSVTSIGNQTFYNCSGLTTITIPDSVISIGSSAFSGCSVLTSVIIGNSVTSIGDSAFYECSGLTSVTIGNSVMSIGTYAFYKCSGLTTITIPDSVISISENAFSNCSGLTSITIPNSVTSIKWGTFSCCSGLTNVTIGNSVTSINQYAFNECSGLISIICNAITAPSIQNTTFNGVKTDGTLTVPVGSTGYDVWMSTEDYYLGKYNWNKVEVLGENQVLCKYNVTDTTSTTKLLYSKSSFASMSIDGVEQSGVVSSYKFNTTGEHTVLFTLKDSVTSIGYQAFKNCSRLTSIIIPDSVTSIGDQAFSDCTGLTSVTIGNSVRSIDERVFESCFGLTSVTIGNSVRSIGRYAFIGCSELISVTIPNSVTSIGESAFGKCSKLTSVIIGNSVTSIDSYAFESCYGLTSITCNAITAPSIQNTTFNGVKTDGTLTVPVGSTGYDVWMGTGNYYLGKYNWNKVEVLGENQVLCKYNVTNTNTSTDLLYSTNNFSSMIVDGVKREVAKSYRFSTTGEHIVLFTLKEGVTSIGEGTFLNCSRLTSITIPDSVTSIGQKAFLSCSGLISITIPDSVTSIGDYVFQNCSSLTTITIPDSVTSIGQRAFLYCSSLTSITIPDSVTSIGESIFFNCSSLTSIIVDSNNQKYDSRNNCNAIIETLTNKLIFGCKNTIIPDSVTSIGNEAFSGCSGLTSITIPDSVTSIGQYAFYNCSGLISITCNALTAPSIQNNTFQSVKTGGTLTVPAGSTGYDVWMGTGNYYLGKYNWNKVE